MKQFIWSDALVSEFNGFWQAKKWQYAFDIQKVTDAFKEMVLSRKEPPDSLFESMANILRPTPPNELDKFTSNIDGETPEEK